MAKTYLEVVNDIMRRLREDTVSNTTDTDYAELIGQIVSDAYKEVQDQHVWESLKHTINVTLVSGRSTYLLSEVVGGGGDVPNNERPCTAESELMWDELSSNCPQVWLFDTGSDTSGKTIRYVSPEVMAQYYNNDTSRTADDPEIFTLYPQSHTSNQDPDLILEVYPEPSSSTRILRMRFWTQAEELVPDGNDDNTRLRIPDRPVYHLALLMALNERGEELGEPGNLAEMRYINALGFAMEKDINMAQRSGRYDWRRE